MASDDPARPNLVARLRGRAEGPCSGCSRTWHLLAEPEGWRHDRGRGRSPKAACGAAGH